MSAITKLLGGMMKGFRRWNFVIEDIFAGEMQSPRKQRNEETHGPRKLKPPFSHFLCRKSVASKLETSEGCEENLQNPSHVQHL